MLRRQLLVALGVGFTGCLHSGGNEGGDSTEMSLNSLAFNDGEEIPTEYTCYGANNSPPLRIKGVPEEAETLALIVDDPDVSTPDRRFVHWLLWNIPAGTEQIPQSLPRGPSLSELGGARQGTNDADEVGYSGPCPPGADGPHTYRFFLYALEKELELEPGATRDELEGAIDNIIAETRLKGTYDS